MPVTVDMIVEKDFKIKVRGYDPVEVDGFLDEICEQMEAMQTEIEGLQARLAQAGQAPAMAVPVPSPVLAPAPAAPVIPQPEKPEKPEKPERSLAAQQDDGSAAAQRLLARAQKFYDNTVAEAQEEASKILRDAHTEAEKTLQQMMDDREALQNEIDMLKGMAHDYRERFRRLLLEQQHVLESESVLFD